MCMDQEFTTIPTQKTRKVRVLVDKNAIEALKQTGVSPIEAINKYAELTNELKETRKRYNELKEKLEFSLEQTSKALATVQQETKFNRRLRYAIQSIHGEKYWEIIQKAERGYYELLLDNQVHQ